MKKLSAGIIIAGLVCTSAFASTEVKYNNAGSVINTGTAIFGQNAIYTPQNAARAGAIQRQIKHEDQYYNGLEKGRTTNININNNTYYDTQSNNNETSSTTSTSRTKRSFIKNKFMKTSSSED